MLILLSPAKTLDFEPSERRVRPSRPRFAGDTRLLLERCRRLDVKTLRQLMKLSEPLAELNHGRFQSMELPHTAKNSKPALLAFRGDVYRKLDAASLEAGDVDWAQERLRILSGFYGMLRPLDLIQPYRLEMGTRLDTERGANLYEFWGERLARRLNRDARAAGADFILNLASNEYVRAVPAAALEVPMVTAVFEEMRDGKPKVIGFSAKRARGLMARWAIRNRVRTRARLRKFAEAGYTFDPDRSERDRLVFLRGGR